MDTISLMQSYLGLEVKEMILLFLLLPIILITSTIATIKIFSEESKRKKSFAYISFMLLFLGSTFIAIENEKALTVDQMISMLFLGMFFGLIGVFIIKKLFIAMEVKRNFIFEYVLFLSLGAISFFFFTLGATIDFETQRHYKNKNDLNSIYNALNKKEILNKGNPFAKLREIETEKMNVLIDLFNESIKDKNITTEEYKKIIIVTSELLLEKPNNNKQEINYEVSYEEIKNDL